MKSKLDFYPFQIDIFDTFEKEFRLGNKKIHIVAPPGSGKTIVGIEMLHRLLHKKNISGNVVIFVPNITLQFQWKEKIKDYFLEDSENIDDIVSFSKDHIKQINILTYQSVSSSKIDDDIFYKKILTLWFQDFQDEAQSYTDFLEYIELLKATQEKEYDRQLKKYKKRVKLSNIKNILTKDIQDYIHNLEKSGVASIIIDEAHHLTNYWSKVIYHIWEQLNKPYIIGLTATPPFEDSDFFTLDDDYIQLLDTIDYYLPTPAIVRAGKLAPYNDLLYCVKPEKAIEENLKKNDTLLDIFIQENKNQICEYLLKYISQNFQEKLKKSPNLLLHYLKFLYNYGNKQNIKEYLFSDAIFEIIDLEDIAKSLGCFMKKIENHQRLNIDVQQVRT
ncbi:DEAD/DEAH box helicase family protein, partial [Candidatus Gracilibacteria bacterium]|nr:DEAD/DEAH box helicase family protein [Candidatus Gracilibacteria bacterium]